MKDYRCLVGRHDWSTELPEGTPKRQGEAQAACRRCGALTHVDVGTADQSRRRGPKLGENRGDGWR